MRTFRPCQGGGRSFYVLRVSLFVPNEHEEDLVTETREPGAVTGTAHSKKADRKSTAGKGEPVQKHQIAHSRPPKYDFAAFELKWRTRWEEQKLYQVDLYRARRPYYNLMMFPYPSGCSKAAWRDTGQPGTASAPPTWSATLTRRQRNHTLAGGYAQSGAFGQARLSLLCSSCPLSWSVLCQ